MSVLTNTITLKHSSGDTWGRFVPSISVDDISVSGSSFVLGASGTVKVQCYNPSGFRQSDSSSERRLCLYLYRSGSSVGHNYALDSVNRSIGWNAAGSGWSTGFTWTYDFPFYSIDTSALFNSDNPTEAAVTLDIKVPANQSSECDIYNYEGSNAAAVTMGSVKVTLNAPPSCTYTQVSDTSGRSAWTQGLSTARVTISGSSAQYGGNVSSVKLIVGTNSAQISGNGTIDVPVTDSGTITPQIVITDSRGQSTTYTLNSITVAAYSAPSISSIELTRVIPAGGTDETQANIKATISQSAVSGNSMGVPRVYAGSSEITSKVTWYTDSAHTASYTSTTDASKTIYGVVDDSEVYEVGSSYSFSFTIADAYSTSQSKSEVLPSIFITMDFQAGGKEIAFGGRAGDDVTDHPKGLFRCDMDVVFTGLVGEIKMFAGATVPSGWLLCDGSTFDSEDYPNLAAALGDLWGTHSGTTYYLPDLGGRMPAGYLASDTDFDSVGETGGYKGAWNHNHTQAGHSHQPSGGSTWYFSANKALSTDTVARRKNGTNGSYYGITGNTSDINAYKYTDAQTPAIYSSGSTAGAAAADADKANMPPYAVVKYIICAY